MRATLLKTEWHKSNMGGDFAYLFFKCEDGKSRRSCLYPRYGNFKRWQEFMGKTGVILENLNIKGNLIDADSWPKEVRSAISTHQELGEIPSEVCG
jgi:hypothetical protein